MLFRSDGANDTLAAGSSVNRRISSDAHMLGEDARRLGADEDLVRPEEDDGAVRRQRPTSEAPGVVLDEAQVAELLRQSAHRPVAGRQGSHPD